MSSRSSVMNRVQMFEVSSTKEESVSAARSRRLSQAPKQRRGEVDGRTSPYRAPNQAVAESVDWPREDEGRIPAPSSERGYGGHSVSSRDAPPAQRYHHAPGSPRSRSNGPPQYNTGGMREAPQLRSVHHPHSPRSSNSRQPQSPTSSRSRQPSKSPRSSQPQRPSSPRAAYPNNPPSPRGSHPRKPQSPRSSQPHHPQSPRSLSSHPSSPRSSNSQRPHSPRSFSSQQPRSSKSKPRPSSSSSNEKRDAPPLQSHNHTQSSPMKTGRSSVKGERRSSSVSSASTSQTPQVYKESSRGEHRRLPSQDENSIPVETKDVAVGWPSEEEDVNPAEQHRRPVVPNSVGKARPSGKSSRLTKIQTTTRRRSPSPLMMEQAQPSSSHGTRGESPSSERDQREQETRSHLNLALKRSLDDASTVLQEERASSVATSSSSLSSDELTSIARKALQTAHKKSVAKDAERDDVSVISTSSKASMSSSRSRLSRYSAARKRTAITRHRADNDEKSVSASVKTVKSGSPSARANPQSQRSRNQGSADATRSGASVSSTDKRVPTLPRGLPRNDMSDDVSVASQSSLRSQRMGRRLTHLQATDKRRSPSSRAQGAATQDVSDDMSVGSQSSRRSQRMSERLSHLQTTDRRRSPSPQVLRKLNPVKDPKVNAVEVFESKPDSVNAQTGKTSKHSDPSQVQEADLRHENSTIGGDRNATPIRHESSAASVKVSITVTTSQKHKTRDVSPLVSPRLASPRAQRSSTRQAVLDAAERSRASIPSSTRPAQPDREDDNASVVSVSSFRSTGSRNGRSRREAFEKANNKKRLPVSLSPAVSLELKRAEELRKRAQRMDSASPSKSRLSSHPAFAGKSPPGSPRVATDQSAQAKMNAWYSKTSVQKQGENFLTQPNESSSAKDDTAEREKSVENGASVGSSNKDPDGGESVGSKNAESVSSNGTDAFQQVLESEKANLNNVQAAVSAWHTRTKEKPHLHSIAKKPVEYPEYIPKPSRLKDPIVFDDPLSPRSASDSEGSALSNESENDVLDSVFSLESDEFENILNSESDVPGASDEARVEDNSAEKSEDLLTSSEKPVKAPEKPLAARNAYLAHLQKVVPASEKQDSREALVAVTPAIPVSTEPSLNFPIRERELPHVETVESGDSTLSPKALTSPENPLATLSPKALASPEKPLATISPKAFASPEKALAATVSPKALASPEKPLAATLSPKALASPEYPLAATLSPKAPVSPEKSLAVRNAYLAHLEKVGTGPISSENDALEDLVIDNPLTATGATGDEKRLHETEVDDPVSYQSLKALASPEKLASLDIEQNEVAVATPDPEVQFPEACQSPRSISSPEKPLAAHNAYLAHLEKKKAPPAPSPKRTAEAFFAQLSLSDSESHTSETPSNGSLSSVQRLLAAAAVAKNRELHLDDEADASATKSQASSRKSEPMMVYEEENDTSSRVSAESTPANSLYFSESDNESAISIMSKSQLMSPRGERSVLLPEPLPEDESVHFDDEESSQGELEEPSDSQSMYQTDNDSTLIGQLHVDSKGSHTEHEGSTLLGQLSEDSKGSDDLLPKMNSPDEVQSTISNDDDEAQKVSRAKDALTWWQKKYSGGQDESVNHIVEHSLTPTALAMALDGQDLRHNQKEKQTENSQMSYSKGGTSELKSSIYSDEESVFSGLDELTRSESEARSPSSSIASPRKPDMDPAVLSNEQSTKSRGGIVITKSSRSRENKSMAPPTPPPQEHCGEVLDESQLVDTVNSDITSSVIATEGVTHAVDWSKKSSLVITEEKSNEIAEEDETIPSNSAEEEADKSPIAKSKSQSSRESSKKSQKKKKQSAKSARPEKPERSERSKSAKPERLERLSKQEARDEGASRRSHEEEPIEEEGDPIFGSVVFMRIGTAILDTFETVCRMPDIPATEGSHRTRFDSNVDTSDAHSIAESALSSTMNDREAKKWDEWDRRETESAFTPNTEEGDDSRFTEDSRNAMSEGDTSSNVFNKQSAAHQKLVKYTQNAMSTASSQETSDESKLLQSGAETSNYSSSEEEESSYSDTSAEDEAVLAASRGKPRITVKTAGTPMNNKPPTHKALPMALSLNQSRILEKFCSSLKTQGIEILKQTRDSKWQVRYLTVSKELTDIKHVKLGNQDAVRCPSALLWLKKFNKSKGYSTSLIDKHGKGGVFMPHLVKVTATGRSDPASNLPKKFQEKYKESVTVIVEYNLGDGTIRSMSLRCKTTDEAHFLCTGMRVCMDVLKRDEEAGN